MFAFVDESKAYEIGKENETSVRPGVIDFFN